jgi:hypothetical protein
VIVTFATGSVQPRSAGERSSPPATLPAGVSGRPTLTAHVDGPRHMPRATRQREHRVGVAVLGNGRELVSREPAHAELVDAAAVRGGHGRGEQLPVGQVRQCHTVREQPALVVSPMRGGDARQRERYQRRRHEARRARRWYNLIYRDRITHCAHTRSAL